MNSMNPYETPDGETKLVSPSILFQSIGVVFGCAFICGLLGMGVGMAIGEFAPGYYETLFSGPNGLPASPVVIGLGLGLTQGIIFGAVLGVVLVALFYWYRLRMEQIKVTKSDIQ